MKRIINIPGIYAYDPRYHDEKVPDIVRSNCVVNLKEFFDWAYKEGNNVNGYVFFDFKESRGSDKRIYIEKNEWRYNNGGLKQSARKKFATDRDELARIMEIYKLPG